MKTKNPYRLLLAALFCGVASVQAQISVFSVYSDSNSGDRVQIAGVFTSVNAILKVQSDCGGTLGTNNMTWLAGPYYSISQGTPGTALANVSSGLENDITTSIETASGSGYTAGPDITACSGRFYIDSKAWVYDHYENGTKGVIYFTVGSSHSFDLIVDGSSNLYGYGLTGLESPVCKIYNQANPGSCIATKCGEGTHGLGTLPAGNYRVEVFGGLPTLDNAPFQSGIVVASIYAN